MNRRSFLRRGVALPAALAGVGVGGTAVAGAGSADPRAAPADFAPLASLRVPGAKEAVVDATGDTAFLAVTDGFAVVDLADPAAPAVVHENREPWAGAGNGRLEQVYDVKLDAANDLLAVVGPANPRDAFTGLVVYDVSDPTAPERVAVHETASFNHNCFAADGHVYLPENTRERNGVVVVDARTGEAVGRWSIADVDERWTEVGPNWVLHDLYVHDGVAYLAHWDAGTWAVDVSDPTAPELLARVRGRDPETFIEMTRAEARRDYSEPPGNDHYTATNDDGSLLGVGVEAWDTDASDDTGGPGGITLFDVSDPSAPEELSFIAPPPTPDPTFGGIWTTSHNFWFRGDRLYTSWYEGGVRVYDVSDPTDPGLLARWRDSDAASMWTAVPAGDREFLVATSHRDGPRAAEGSSSERAALYTFPDPPADAAPLTPTPGATPTATGTPTDASPTATSTDTPTRTPTSTPTGTASGTGAEPTATGAAGPGFGPLAALGGLGLGAWRILGGDGGTE